MPDPRARRRWRSAFVAVIALAIAWFVSGVVAAWALSHRWSGPEAERAPLSGDVAVETLELGTSDSLFVRAWLFAPDAPGASVVMLHGWRGSRSTVAHRAEALARSGHAVLTPSLRAHGDSAGSHYDFGREAWRDVAACVDLLTERRPGKPIVLVGFSYGAAVAAEAAVREGARIDGLVLDSGFASLRDALRNRCELFLPPVLEDLAAWGLFAAAPFVFPELDEITPERRCASLQPALRLLILRGGQDERVTASEAERIAAAAEPRSTLVVFPDAEHDRCYENDPERWVSTVDAYCGRIDVEHGRWGPRKVSSTQIAVSLSPRSSAGRKLDVLRSKDDSAPSRAGARISLDGAIDAFPGGEDASPSKTGPTMTEMQGALQRAFISHSWKNKALARRIGRRLAHRGVAVWIDESEMQVGDRLSNRLADEIRRSSHLVVVLTADAAASKWVAQELDVAMRSTDRSIAVIPLIAERGIAANALDDFLGVEIFDPLSFEERMDVLAGAILGAPASHGRDASLLRRDLDAIARETPVLRGLIRPLADVGNITRAQLGAAVIDESSRHAAETALMALHELGNASARQPIALAAASLYRRSGVGFEVLRRQLSSQTVDRCDTATLLGNLADRFERTELLDGALRLFHSASVAPNAEFAEFVRANFESFTPPQRDLAVAFIVTPDRGPNGFAIDVAYELFARMPDCRPLHELWWSWVQDHRIGGKGEAVSEHEVRQFYFLMNCAEQTGLTQFQPIVKYFESCFGDLVKTCDILKLLARPLQLLCKASDESYVGRHGLARRFIDVLESYDPSTMKASGFYAPLRKLGEAVERDKSYVDPLYRLYDLEREYRPTAAKKLIARRD